MRIEWDYIDRAYVALMCLEHFTLGEEVLITGWEPGPISDFWCFLQKVPRGLSEETDEFLEGFEKKLKYIENMLDMFQLYRHKERLDEYRAVLLPTPPPTPSTAVQAHVPAATSNFSPNHDCSPPCSPAGSPTAVSDSVTPTPPAQGAVSKNGIISRVENMSMQVETFEKPSQTTSSWHQTPHSPVRSKVGITQTAMSSSGSATITTASTPLLQDTRNIHTSTASFNVMTKAKENPTH